jgi:hypothetical protein
MATDINTLLGEYNPQKKMPAARSQTVMQQQQQVQPTYPDAFSPELPHAVCANLAAGLLAGYLAVTQRRALRTRRAL